MTIISRQSSRRAGTRFNSRGIDDHGNVANFVETEIVLWVPPDRIYSYTQIRGSVPIFWEQAPGFLPGQQRIEVTRSIDAAQHAFSKHFEVLQSRYGSVHVVNLLSEEKPGEAELSLNFRDLIRNDPRKRRGAFHEAEFQTFPELTEYDFHAETRGPLGYDASSQIKHKLSHLLEGFEYFLGDVASKPTLPSSRSVPENRCSTILRQKGIFRTNCLDCLDRTNLVQSIISSAVLESFLRREGGKLTPDIQRRHATIWLITEMHYQKFMLVPELSGALLHDMGKCHLPAHSLTLGKVRHDLFEELQRRASEYTLTKSIRIWTGTLNVNGRSEGLNVDLTPWLFPLADQESENPTIFAVAFQEIVPLNPQQIMSTDPTTRKVWENTVSYYLNDHPNRKSSERYVLLRSAQLVGAALMVYVKQDALSEIKNVEASTKKAGFQGISGNKGGCAIRFEYSNTRICFVTAHLAAGQANYSERNRDYEAILRGLLFQRNITIEDHDAILWLGDFNYRIGLTNEFTRQLVRQRDYQKLYDNDQLNQQMAAGMAFKHYAEGRITFPPTYKYDIGTNEYDTSEKARIPAWCDRVLWKGPNLHQTHYNSADLRFSDHRPVWATFDCMISAINEVRKVELRRLLYDGSQQKANQLWHTGIEEEIPETCKNLPASSEYHRWWLDNGQYLMFPMISASADFEKAYQRDIEVDWGLLSHSVAPQRDLINTGMVHTFKRNLPEQSNQPPTLPISNMEADSDATATGHHTLIRPFPQSSGSNPQTVENQEASHPFVTPTDRRQVAEDGVEDLLGGSVEEDVNWRPLLR
ncbi:hypothetical protein PHISCL_04393 [Aspergillus sclerotialis]|uniref:phosphoinositide 5-phosphatase n=1 Tax=Aspergillus sclerotialis TaxID=2070753 RepID=A0A3A2ZJC6_9EURO|nr:hypothetical protein PHISCL_04393 [Aspergillus sclerotialis]